MGVNIGQKYICWCQICPKMTCWGISCALAGSNMASYYLASVYGLILDGKCAILSDLDSNESGKRAKMPFMF